MRNALQQREFAIRTTHSRRMKSGRLSLHRLAHTCSHTAFAHGVVALELFLVELLHHGGVVAELLKRVQRLFGMNLLERLATKRPVVDEEGEQRGDGKAGDRKQERSQVHAGACEVARSELDAHVEHVVAADRDHDGEALAGEVGKRTGDSEGREDCAQHPCRDQDVERGDLLGDLLQAHEQDLEERGEQTAHKERVHKQHAALGLCDAEVVIEPDRAADPANRDADSGEQHVEPHDEPHTVPDALAHLLVVLRPGAHGLHADRHREAGEREQRAERRPFLDVLIARKAAQDAADHAHADKRSAAHEERHRRAYEHGLPERENRLGDEREGAAHQEAVDNCLVWFHDHPLQLFF